SAWPRRPSRAASTPEPPLAPHPGLVTRVTLFHAAGCHLCERARAVLLAAREKEPFELEEVDITGDPELEERYRAWLPVVEIEGERAFVYFVFEDQLLHKLRLL